MQLPVGWVFFGGIPGLLGERAHRDIIPFFLVTKASLGGKDNSY